MTTQTIKSLGNTFEYNTTELKINGIVQSETLHESFNDFLQGSIYTEGHLAGRLNDALFCEFFGVTDNTMQTKNIFIKRVSKKQDLAFLIPSNDNYDGFLAHISNNNIIIDCNCNDTYAIFDKPEFSQIDLNQQVKNCYDFLNNRLILSDFDVYCLDFGNCWQYAIFDKNDTYGKNFIWFIAQNKNTLGFESGEDNAFFSFDGTDSFLPMIIGQKKLTEWHLQSRHNFTCDTKGWYVADYADYDNFAKGTKTITRLQPTVISDSDKKNQILQAYNDYFLNQSEIKNALQGGN
jgi:hypothetical protein